MAASRRHSSPSCDVGWGALRRGALLTSMLWGLPCAERGANPDGSPPCCLIGQLPVSQLSSPRSAKIFPRQVHRTRILVSAFACCAPVIGLLFILIKGPRFRSQPPKHLVAEAIYDAPFANMEHPQLYALGVSISHREKEMPRWKLFSSPRQLQSRRDDEGRVWSCHGRISSR